MKKSLFENLTEVYKEIENDFKSSSTKIKVGLIYAFNGTGKTRLSRLFNDLLEDKVLCFNSMFQDEFAWDNNKSTLNINVHSWIVKFIQEQGLENSIENNYPFELEIEITGFFTTTGDAVDRFKANAIAIMYPYVRAIVSTYTALANIPPLILPAINVNALLEQQNNNKKRTE